MTAPPSTVNRPPPEWYAPRFLLLAALLLAAWLRFYRIAHQSYWNDEGNSRAMTEKSVGGIVLSVAADIHPPGYYLALKGWRALAGESELVLRGFSAFAGIVLVALLYRLGREYFDESAAVAAAFLGAVNPFLIYYSQEARMYELVTALGAASFLLFSMWLRASRPPPPTPPLFAPANGGGPGWGLSLGYCAVSALGLYTHYAFPFVLIAQNLAALGGLLFHRRGAWLKRLGAWIGLQALTLLLFLPWLPTAYRQLTTWPATRKFHPFFSALADVMRYLAFGRTVQTTEVMWGLWAVGALLFLGVWRGGQTITPLLWLLVPAGLTLAFGLLSEPFSKFLLVAVPPLCLLMANGLVPTGRRTKDERRRMPAFVIGHLSFVVLCGAVIGYTTYQSLSNLYFNPAYLRDDYRGIEQYLESVERPADAIIIISPNQVEAFGYYHRSGAPIYPLPHTRPLDEAETTTALEAIAKTHERIFVLFWGDEQADPEHFVEDWLNTHTYKARDQWYGQVRLAIYGVEAAAGRTSPVEARFGEHVTLTEYRITSTTLFPDDTLQLALFWQTDAPLAERYKVFVHLYADPAQPPATQQDGEPGGGLVITTIWKPGESIEDKHGVLMPRDLPAGEYRLMVGLYNLVDGTRLPVTLNGVEMGDRLDLGTIVVK